MPYAKGSGNKFTLQRTNRNVPVITQPQEIIEAIALTNSAEIDSTNSEKLYFHIFGAVPSQMKLFIYGELFNTNFYTEIGQHLHPVTGDTGNVSTGTTSHNHFFGIISTTDVSLSVNPSSHHHRVNIAASNGSDTGIDSGSGSTTYLTDAPSDGQYIEDTSLSVSPSTHHHDFSGTTASVNVNTHGHSVNINSANVGFTPAARTSGTAKTYFNNMQISIDGVDQTTALLAQAGLAKFGDGTAGHVIVTTGVELNLNPFISTPGQHKIVFSLLIGDGLSNGGKLRYNLYLLA